METIKRYGVKMGDLNGNTAFKNSGLIGCTVPKEFLETKGRLWFRRMIRATGLFSFVVTTLTALMILFVLLLPSLVSEEFENVLVLITASLFLVNHLGLFLEMGGDSLGENWFAKGAGMMWLFLLGSFFIAVVIEVFRMMIH